MSMQLFTFGHPCEHQLRRACIGGSSCPLNGYPDAWCCSYIKGKINFKRDKPCEGSRCRWGFTHPPQSQFDAVTQVLNESRPIAAKIDDAEDGELLVFHIENPHLVDTVQCAIHMMRHPPSSCASRVGQLLAYAAVKAGDAKVFMQLLKTMKKPVDGYILGAYEYLSRGNLPTPNANAVTQSSNPPPKPGAKTTKGAASSAVAPKKEDTVEELKSGIIDVMNAALSQAGQLVDREDQHTLQIVFIQALRQWCPKSNRKRQEMLEGALRKFGDRPAQKEAKSANSTPAQTSAVAVAASNNSNATETPSKSHATGASVTLTTVTNAGASNRADKNAASEASSSANQAAAVTGNTTSAAVASGTANTTANVNGGTPANTSATTNASLHNANIPNAAAASAAASQASRDTSSPASRKGATATTANNNPAAVNASSSAAATQPATKDPTGAPTSSTTSPPPPPKQPKVGISTVTQFKRLTQSTPLTYAPIRTDQPLPDLLILGGQFSLGPPADPGSFSAHALLGCASRAVDRQAPTAGDTKVQANFMDEPLFGSLAADTSLMYVDFLNEFDHIRPTDAQIFPGLCSGLGQYQ